MIGFFRNLRKNYKHNTLVWLPHSLRLVRKAQAMPDSKFIKHWAFHCAVSVDGIIRNLLFSEIGKKIPVLKKNLNKLNKESVFEMIKLLVGFHLAIFMRNKDSIDLLKKINLSQQTFKEDVFSFFSFTSEDKKIFRELDEKFDLKDSIKYYWGLFEKIFEKAYGMPNLKDPIAFMVLTKYLLECCKYFFLFLGKEIRAKFEYPPPIRNGNVEIQRAGYCQGCKKHVWLKEDGSCQFGHPVSRIKKDIDINDTDLDLSEGAHNVVHNKVDNMVKAMFKEGIKFKAKSRIEINASVRELENIWAKPVLKDMIEKAAEAIAPIFEVEKKEMLDKITESIKLPHKFCNDYEEVMGFFYAIDILKSLAENIDVKGSLSSEKVIRSVAELEYRAATAAKAFVEKREKEEKETEPPDYVLEDEMMTSIDYFYLVVHVGSLTRRLEKYFGISSETLKRRLRKITEKQKGSPLPSGKMLLGYCRAISNYQDILNEQENEGKLSPVAVMLLANLEQVTLALAQTLLDGAEKAISQE